jgi:hypothetical protein
MEILRWGASAVPDEWWQVIHGTRRIGSPTVGVVELEAMALGAVGGAG